MNKEEAIDILKNCIADYVIGDFCVGKFCPMEKECKDKECVFEQAIDIVSNYIEKLENMYNKEHNEHIEMKRQNGVLRNNERILREKNKKAKEYVQNLRQYFSEDCQADFVNIIELLGEGD